MAEEEHSIHQFSKKLLQKSLFPRLKNYILWQQGKGELRSEDFVPISVNLDLTSACSNRCTHCIDKIVLNMGRSLDLDYIKDLLGYWKERGLKSVIVIGGGEPTLHPNFEEVIEFLKKDLSLQVGIASNGTRIERIAKICHLLGKKDWVRLSLDAGTNETFLKIHHPLVDITLEKIVAGVKEMRSKYAGFQMGYSFLIIGDNKYVDGVTLVNNIKEISAAAALAKENGFSYFSLKPVITPEGSRETSISQENLREIEGEAEKAKAQEDGSFKVVESVNLLCFYDEELKKAMQLQPKTCHAQFFRTVVNPEGVLSCSFWRGFKEVKIAEVNQKVDDKYIGGVREETIRVLKNLDAKNFCKEVHCLYGPFNCWLENLLQSPEAENIQPIEDFNDYFI